MSLDSSYPARLPPADPLRQIVNGYWLYRAVYVVAKLGVADLLADGSKSSQELASLTESDPRVLYRVLRLVASSGMLAEDDARTFSLTPLGNGLRSDVPGSRRSHIILMGEPMFWNSWGKLYEGVKTGDSPFSHAFDDEFFAYMRKNPEHAVVYNGAMGNAARVRAEAVEAAYDFAGVGTVVDVGGGNGTLISTILAAHPQLRGILFDQPAVVAESGPTLSAAGVADRCQVVGGSFFEAVPEGGDAYTLSQIIHDWPDEHAATILRSCQRAMAPGARLLIIDQVIPPGNEPHQSKYGDVMMFVVHGAQERTAAEFAALLDGTGFSFQRVIPTTSQWSVVEAVRR
jgi:O-methyltransferase domain